MSNATEVSREQAEAAFAAVKAQFAPYLADRYHDHTGCAACIAAVEADVKALPEGAPPLVVTCVEINGVEHGGMYVGPQPNPALVENWEWGWHGSNTYRWAIVWEEGPYEWALRAGCGGVDEERLANIAGEVAPEAALKFATDPPAEVPEGVFLEAITSWAVGVHLA